MMNRFVSRISAALATTPGRLSVVAVAILLTMGAIDRKEYDLILTVRAEAVPQQRIAFLDQWAKQYPKSELGQVRRELYLRAYQEIGDNAKMLLTAEDMVREQPDSFVGVYWCSLLLPASKVVSTDRLKTGDAAARQLLSGLDTYFAPGKKPASTAEADWQKQKSEVERLAHRALGWIEWQRGNHEAAEKEFTACLQKNPNDAEISAWYGTVLTLEKKQEKLPLAFWQMARAASLKEDGGLPDGQRRAINNLLSGLYTAYHGSSEGLERLLADSVGSVDPPATFTVESGSLIAQRKADQEFEKAEPERFYWKKLRTRLEAAEGDAYFADSVKGTRLPRLKGWLVRGEPAARPKNLVIGISDPNAEEVILKLSAPLTGPAETGSVLFFESGMADSFTKSPFALTVEVDKDKLEGWVPKPRK
jgi:tetratricopeptide (TPR) repeat protein